MLMSIIIKQFNILVITNECKLFWAHDAANNSDPAKAATAATTITGLKPKTKAFYRSYHCYGATPLHYGHVHQFLVIIHILLMLLRLRQGVAYDRCCEMACTR